VAILNPPVAGFGGGGDVDLTGYVFLPDPPTEWNPSSGYSGRGAIFTFEGGYYVLVANDVPPATEGFPMDGLTPATAPDYFQPLGSPGGGGGGLVVAAAEDAGPISNSSAFGSDGATADVVLEADFDLDSPAIVDIFARMVIDGDGNSATAVYVDGSILRSVQNYGNSTKVGTISWSDVRQQMIRGDGGGDYAGFINAAAAQVRREMGNPHTIVLPAGSHTVEVRVGSNEGTPPGMDITDALLAVRATPLPL